MSDVEDLDDDEDNQPISLLVNGNLVWTATWFTLVNEQLAGLTVENFAERVTVGDVCAFEDKSFLEADDWRPIFLVFLETEVLLFDVDGCVLDEPEHGTPKGRQSLVDFTDDWKGGYYAVGEGEEVPKPTSGNEDSDADEEIRSPAKFVPAVGSRIKMSMGLPAAWYGGLVFKDEENADSILCAYDDGELRSITYKKLAECAENKELAVATDAEGGIVENQSNRACAAALTFVAPGGRAKQRPAGVLIGPTAAKLGDDIIYQKHVVDPTAFSKVPALQVTD